MLHQTEGLINLNAALLPVSHCQHLTFYTKPHAGFLQSCCTVWHFRDLLHTRYPSNLSCLYFPLISFTIRQQKEHQNMFLLSLQSSNCYCVYSCFEGNLLCPFPAPLCSCTLLEEFCMIAKLLGDCGSGGCSKSFNNGRVGGLCMLKCLGSTSGPSSGRTCLKCLAKKVSRKYANQIPEPP